MQLHIRPRGVSRPWGRALALTAAIVAPGVTSMAQTVVTNWVVFNDHVPADFTAPGVCGYNLWTGPGGYLTNYAKADEYSAGQELVAHLDVSTEGSVASQATMLLPDPGTPADLLFGSVLDLNGPSFLFTLNQPGKTVLTFSGLDPQMKYRFQTTGIRGRQDDAPDRWSVCTLEGAASFTEAFTSLGGSNAISKLTFPSSTLTNGQIAWNSGRNQDAGDLIGWDQIVPGAEGTISIVTEQYTGPVPGGSGAGAYGYGLAGFELIEYGPRTAVSIAAQPVAQTTVEQARPFLLSVRVAGSSPKLQWYKQGVGPIAGATEPVLSIAAAAVADSGDYYAVVKNSSSTATSAVARVTVNADTVPPTVVVVRGSGDFDQLDTVKVSFSEIVQASQDVGNYTVEGFTTTSAQRDDTYTNVVLKLNKALTPGQTYNLTVKNIKDVVGNPVATATISFPAFALAPGFLSFDYFGGLDSGNNDIEATLLADARFPNSPDWSSFITAFDSRTIFPDDSHEAYGARVSAFFTPPTSGNWIFYLRSDDSSRLFFNPAGTDPAGKELIIEETSCCGAFDKLPSNPISLTAGKQYYIEAIYKEGTGGDFLQVAGKLDSDNTEPNSLTPLPGKLFSTLADPAGASVTITQQPMSLTVVPAKPEGGPLTLRDDKFDSTDGGYTVSSSPAPDLPWEWTGAGTWACSSPGGSGPYATHLIAPTVTVPGAGTLSLTFNHRYSMEDASTYYDGGIVQISVNGGEYTPVPAKSFTANGYSGILVGTHEIGAQAAFAGTSAGYDSYTYMTTTAYLGAFNAGDTVSYRFVAAWDANTEGTEPNWEIDSVKLELGAVAPNPWATFTVGASVLYQGQTSPTVSYVWQRDNGSGFQDITGGSFLSPLNEPTYSLPVSLSDNGAKFRCIVKGLLSSATTEVATLTVTTNPVVRPTLTAQLQGANVIVSWPLSATGFQLQQSSALPATGWTTVPASSYMTGPTSTYVTLPSSGTAFFRLVQ